MDSIKRPRAEAYAELAPMPTDDFLRVLFAATRTLADTSDPFEVIAFANQCYEVAGKEPPDFYPLYRLYSEDDD